MKNTTLSILTVLLLLGLFQTGFALEQTVGLRGGMSYPLTDISNHVDLGPVLGVSYEAWLKDYLSVGIYPYYTKLSAGEIVNGYHKGGPFLPTRFEATVIGADLLVKFQPDKNFVLDFQRGCLRRIAPFAELGLGLAYYNTITDIADPDGKIAVVLPSAGLGVSFLTKWDFNVDLSLQLDHTLTDLVDDLDENDANDAYFMLCLGVGYNFGYK
jgi:hypothetical protein